MALPPFSPHHLLVTGGAGFIGAAVVRHALAAATGARVTVLDALTYAGDRDRLADLEGRFAFVHGDVRDADLVARLLADGVDAVLHLAAETHVDRAIRGPAPFVSTNVVGMQVLLDAVRHELARRARPFRFVNVGTDEVYGAIPDGAPPADEEHPLLPRNPYAASKAGADCLVRAYRETYGLPCLTTRGANTYGPWQHPEKLVPVVCARALEGERVPVYGDGLQRRDWLHVDDHAAAVWAVLARGDLADEVYNVAGGAERTNLDVARALLDALGRPASLLEHVADRPGHDRRYAMDDARIRRALGWAPARDLAAGLRETAAWYAANAAWWRPRLARS